MIYLIYICMLFEYEASDHSDDMENVENCCVLCFIYDEMISI